MLFFNFIEKNSIIYTGLALLFLLFSAFYAETSSKRRGFYYVWSSFVILILEALLQYNAEYFYSRAVSPKILIFIEMILIIINSLLLVIAASYFLFKKTINIAMLFGFISCCFLITIYAIFIANNAHIVDNIRQILPLIGMIYVLLSYVLMPKFWQYIGNVMAIFTVGGFVFLMLYPMLFESEYSWYLIPLLMTSLGISFILMTSGELKKTELQLKKDYENIEVNIRNIIKSSPFPIVLSRLGDDKLLMANNNALQLFGLEESEIHRYHFKDFFVDTENRKILLERLERNREVHNFEILVKTAIGNTPFWLLLSANIIKYNNDIVLYSAFQDITSRKRHESFLQSQADRDPLTSIYNRRYFETKITDKIKNAHMKKIPFAIFMIDADNFKNINDKYGHKTGDKVLIELANICERSLRQEDVVARYGGEEFVVYVDNVDANTAVMVANRLRKSIAESVVYSDDKNPILFSVSIGVAPSGISDSVSVMIKMADDAMYLAKQNGKNRVELYDKELIEKLNLIENNVNKIQKHPAFSEEDVKEISLLDGIETVSMIED